MPPGIPATPGSTSATRAPGPRGPLEPRQLRSVKVVTTGADTPEGALSGPDFLNFGPDGRLYVSDNNKRVYSFNITG